MEDSNFIDKRVTADGEEILIDYSELFKKKKPAEGMEGGRCQPDKKPGRDNGR